MHRLRTSACCACKNICMTYIVGGTYNMHLYTYPYVAYIYTYTNRCFDALSFAAVSLQLRACFQLICGLRMHTYNFQPYWQKHDQRCLFVQAVASHTVREWQLCVLFAVTRFQTILWGRSKVACVTSKILLQVSMFNPLSIYAGPSQMPLCNFERVFNRYKENRLNYLSLI